MIEGKPSGLILNHAYGLNDIMEFDDPDHKGQKLRLLRLRNPWGNSEWNGAWSDKSQEMKEYSHLIQGYIESLAPDEKFNLGDDDGTFFMCYDDWKDNFFSILLLNDDFLDHWTGVRFKSKWIKSNAGGPQEKCVKSILEDMIKTHSSS